MPPSREASSGPAHPFRYNAADMNPLRYANLDVLRRHVADESADLVYVDPPVNSNASDNVLLPNETAPTVWPSGARDPRWQGFPGQQP